MAKKSNKKISTEKQKQRRANSLEASRNYRKGALSYNWLEDRRMTKKERLEQYESYKTPFGSIYLMLEERKARRKTRKTGDSYYYDLFKDKYFR